MQTQIQIQLQLQLEEPSLKEALSAVLTTARTFVFWPTGHHLHPCLYLYLSTDRLPNHRDLIAVEATPAGCRLLLSCGRP